jgi:hypothetical protein
LENDTLLKKLSIMESNTSTDIAQYASVVSAIIRLQQKIKKNQENSTRQNHSHVPLHADLPRAVEKMLLSLDLPTRKEELNFDPDTYGKPGSRYVTPPENPCSVHIEIQWRSHAFDKPCGHGDVEPVLDYGASVSNRCTLPAPNLLQSSHVSPVSSSNDTSVSSSVIQQHFGPHRIMHHEMKRKKIKVRKRRTGSVSAWMANAGRTLRGRNRYHDAAGGFIGVPKSTIFGFESGDVQQVKFFEYYKSDPVCHDEALGIKGICITPPVSCDRVLNIYGIDEDTERHCLLKRSDFVSSTGAKRHNISQDPEAIMGAFKTDKGVAYETKTSAQLRCDTGEEVFTSGDGTVPYSSLRWSTVWQRSKTWRQQRRIMLNNQLDGILGEKLNPEEEVGCEVSTLEVPGWAHREMLGTTSLKNMLAEVLNPTLTLNIKSISGFEKKLPKYQHSSKKRSKWFIEMELLPKEIEPDVAKKLKLYKTSKELVGSTKTRLCYQDGEAHCYFNESIIYDARLNINLFLGLCGRIRFAPSKKVYAAFFLPSRLFATYANRPLVVDLADGLGQVCLELMVNRSGDFNLSRLENCVQSIKK